MTEENKEMDAEKDIFSESFEDEAGGVVSDLREDEPLPPEEREDGTQPEREGKSAPAEDGRRSREILRFVKEFPDVSASDVPAEVWNRVRDGESLSEAYAKFQIRSLRAENVRLRAMAETGERESLNRSRAAGSQAGTGGTGRDAFDEGWEGAF